MFGLILNKYFFQKEFQISCLVLLQVGNTLQENNLKLVDLSTFCTILVTYLSHSCPSY